MPNGRTDIFEVETDKLLESLGLIETDASIGTLFDSGSSTSLNVSLVELRSSVRQHDAPRITIEEQHGCEYIVHTGHPVGGWVCIDQSSPVFTQIRGLHSVEVIAPIRDAAENQRRSAGAEGHFAQGEVMAENLDPTSEKGTSGFPWVSALSLLYPISATIYIAESTPAPPVMITGYGLANLGYLLFAAGIFTGTFGVFGLKR